MNRFKGLITAMLLWAGLASVQAAEPIPYHNPCENISTVTVHSEVDRPAASLWAQYNYPVGSVFRCKPASADGQGTGTIWTPSLALQAGKTYKVTVYMGVQNVYDTTRGEVALYASPDLNADKVIVAEQIPAASLGPASQELPPPCVGYFTADGSKTYLGVGRRGYGVNMYFAVADILVEEYDGPLPLEAPSGFSGTADGKSVTLSWTLPAKDMGGKAVDRIDKVSISRDGFTVKEWTDRAPGETMQYVDFVSSLGDNRYTLTCETSGKTSQALLTVTVSGGAETPNICTGYDKDSEGNYIGRNYYAKAFYVPGTGVTISWYPATVQEGATPKYKVTRLSDGKVIADGITATSATDTDISDAFALYQYKITVNDGTADKALYTSSVVSLNNAMPFVPAITADALNEFTVIDGDRDTYAWVAVNGVSGVHGVARGFNSSRRGDDWMITPGLTVEADKTYRIDVDAYCGSMVESIVEMQVKAGRANSVDAMTDEIVPAIIFKHLKPQTYSGYYNASEAANLFVGIRSLDPNGQNKFNDLGVSRIAIYEVSTETPEAIADLRVVYSSTPGKASLDFTAPSKSIAGATLAKIDRIEVEKNGEPFQTLTDVTAGTECSVPVELELGVQDVYTLIPYTSGGAGLTSTISVMVLEPPYSNTFDSEADATGFTALDPKVSGYSWGYYNNAMRLYKGISNAADDYLVSPPIHLEKGNFYKLDFLSWLDRADTDYIYDNQVEVLLGNAPTVEALTQTIIEPFYVRGAFDSKILAKEWFTVPESGEYYIAWHGISEPGLARDIFVDEINIGAKIPDVYPAGVDNLVITPDPQGALKATVSFDLPSKDLAGRTLDPANFYEYRVYCDGVMISNDLPGTPGKHVDYSHTTTQGVHLYTVRCFGAKEEPTRDVETIAYVGINRPGPVPFVEVSEDTSSYGTITLTWDVPETDIDGFPLNTTDITYTVGQYYTDMSTGQSQEIEYANGIRDLSYTRAVKSSSDTQEFMRFFVRANTTAGKGNPTVLTKWNAVGRPFDLPFKESFANGVPKYNMMQERPFEGKFSSWGYNTYNPVTGVQPVDGDRGLAMMEVGETESGARLFTLRINLNAEKPAITFYVYNQGNANRTDDNLLGISVREGNGEFQTVAMKSVHEWTAGAPGWQKVQVDLSDYAGKTVYIGFDAIAKNLTFTHIDNIIVATPPAVDLTLRSVSHDKVYVGTDHTVSVTVINSGSQPVEGATVDVKLDGSLFKTLPVERIEAGGQTVVSFTNQMSRQDMGNHFYSATLNVEGDADLLDNSYTAASFYVADNDFPTARQLEAKISDDNVNVSWEAPVLPDEPQEITDDFESYPSWSTMSTGGIGDYTLYDRDGCPVGGFQDHDLPNIPFGSKQSFTLWDFSDEYFAYDQSQSDRYKAHSGDKCLVSIYAPGGEDWTEDQIVSPLLPGHAQTIKFWAKSLEDSRPEIFQVYYSLTGKNLADYFDHSFPRVTVGGTWTEYSYDLPEGTKYFVIEHYGNRYLGGYFFFLDDLTYTPVGPETLELRGYNVYRNGVKITASPIVEQTWSEPYSTKARSYGVTAVYDRGESQLIEVEPTTTGIYGVNASVRIYTEGGEIVVEGAEGLDLTVANMGGLLLTNRKADTPVTRIPAAPGVYVIRVADHTSKVIVK